MRVTLLSLSALTAVLFPFVGNAQVAPMRPAPPPQVTAAAAAWQVQGEPIVVDGLVYLPTRETRFFDGQVMVQVGIYRRVPVYTDVTLEPYSIVYVPLTRDRMRTYERRREGELAGTTGSRTPSFPVASPATVASIAAPEDQIVPTTGVVISGDAAPAYVAPVAPRSTVVQTIPPARSTGGVWIEFRGTRWYSAGEAQSYLPERFTRIGEYRGFPVFHAHGGTTDTIWVQAVSDGPLAPYTRR